MKFLPCRRTGIRTFDPFSTFFTFSVFRVGTLHLYLHQRNVSQGDVPQAEPALPLLLHRLEQVLHHGAHPLRDHHHLERVHCDENLRVAQISRQV